MRKNNKSTPLYIIAGIVVLAVSSFIFSHFIGFFAINTENCINGRYFYVNRLNKRLKDGDYVVFYFKGSSLYPKNFKFIKIVGCVSGERLISRNTPKGYAYFCNNKLLGYACNPNKNPKCPKHVKYNTIIPKGYFYALGTRSHAYDSRYWGLASIKSVIGIGYKIF